MFNSALIIFVFCLSFHTVYAIESRVFDGIDLRFDVHRYLVNLKAHHQENQHSRCSGSIIANSWIVTSAHCFAKDVENVTVYHHVEDSVRVIAKVDKHNVILHPLYTLGDNSMDNRRYDIALLKTTTPIKYSDYVQPVKLTDKEPRIYQSAIIAGYGNAEEDLPVPREGFVELVRCPFRLGGLLCSDHTVRAGSGDSGGSLISKGRLVGVTSGSCRDVHIQKRCLTVYTSVVAHLKWIKEVYFKKSNVNVNV